MEQLEKFEGMGNILEYVFKQKKNIRNDFVSEHSITDWMAIAFPTRKKTDDGAREFIKTLGDLGVLTETKLLNVRGSETQFYEVTEKSWNNLNNLCKEHPVFKVMTKRYDVIPKYYKYSLWQPNIVEIGNFSKK